MTQETNNHKAQKNQGKNDITTSRLMRMLETSPNHFLASQIAQRHKDMQFHEYLFQLMEQKNIQTTDLITGSCISKTYAYQFVNGERLPGRDIILRMAFFLKLKIEETQRLLTLAGKNILYPKIYRDAAILFCLHKKMSLDEANFFLEDLGEETLL